MKKKFSLWLNIVTICLCVCAIMVGVYAATSATLTVSGQIGFTAHGCEGTVSGTIVGHAKKEVEGEMVDHKDGMPVETPESLGDAVNFGEELSYGSRYFTDMATTDGSVTPITIVLTVTNTSLYPIEGQLVLPETEFAQKIDFDVENGLVQLAATNTTDDTDVGTITITMKLKSTTENIETPVDLDFSIDFEKYTQIKGDSTNGYYMTMGSNVVTTNGVQQVELVKWLPFAVNNGTSSTPNWAPFVNTNKPDTTKEHYWISEKVLDIGTTTVSGSGSNQYTNDAGVPFNPYVDHGTERDRREGMTSLDANIYLTSNVRDLLQGKDAYKSAVALDEEWKIYEPGEEKVNLLKEYGITGYVYDSLIERTAQDLYGKAVPDSLSAHNTNEDKLWLLSCEELGYLLNDDISYTDFGFNITSEQQALLQTQTLRQGANSSWWLRSPHGGVMYYEWWVNKNGSVDFTFVNNVNGVRPAFKI